MKIAVATRQFRRVAGHAGRARQWLLLDVGEKRSPAAPTRVELEPAQVFHVRGDGPHPLDGAEVLIAMSAGPGFVKRMMKRGVTVALTSETDPLRAADEYFAGMLKPPHPPGLSGWLCRMRDRFSEHA